MSSNDHEAVSLSVAGMTCGSCQRHVQQALAAVTGVDRAEVDLAQSRATVRYDPAAATPQQLVEAVLQAGYRAEVEDVASEPAPIRGRSCGCCATQIS